MMTEEREGRHVSLFTCASFTNQSVPPLLFPPPVCSSVVIVQLTCLLVIFGLFVTLMFGRSLVAIIQGTVGIIISTETYWQVGRGGRRILKYYATWAILNAGVSIGVGATVLAGADGQCRGAANLSTCSSTQVLYGLIMLVGSAALGVFASINSLLVYTTLALTSGGSSSNANGSSGSSSGGGSGTGEGEGGQGGSTLSGAAGGVAGGAGSLAVAGQPLEDEVTEGKLEL